MLVKDGSFDSDQVKRFKSSHYQETINLLNKGNKLNEENNNSTNYFKLKIVDTGEKGGKKKHHYLDFEEIKVDADISNNSQMNNNIVADIHYQVTQLPKPLWFAKPFMSIELTNWRLKLYLFIPLILFLFSCYLFFRFAFSPSTQEIINLTLFVTVISVLWNPLIPFFTVNHMRIAIAPQWLLRFKQATGQLESVKLNKLRKNGNPYRKIELVIYEADCPTCGNKVEIYQGKKEFKGRLIGECTESPREHIFSFDHVTQSGVRLR